MTRDTSAAPLRVAAFTGGRNTPSVRFRVRQLIQPLGDLGIRVREYVARFGSWPPENRAVRPLWAAATLLDRVPGVLASRRHDLTLLQREMVSTFCTLEPFTRAPRVLDLDDAVWLNRERPIRRLVSLSAGVVCGNSFIADWVSSYHDRFIVIPTLIDTDRFVPSTRGAESRVVGWIGSRSGLGYLLSIESALKRVLERHPTYRIRIVCDRRPELRHLRPENVEFIRWSEERDIPSVQEMSIGVMPLDDSDWSRGKCSLKMLQAMACGRPVVVSPVGTNREILAHANVGVAARTEDEWVEALSWLIEHPEQRAAMGAAGRRVVEEHFSVRRHAPRLAEFLRSLSSRK